MTYSHNVKFLFFKKCRVTCRIVSRVIPILILHTESSNHKVEIQILPKPCVLTFQSGRYCRIWANKLYSTLYFYQFLKQHQIMCPNSTNQITSMDNFLFIYKKCKCWKSTMSMQVTFKNKIKMLEISNVNAFQKKKKRN